MAFILVAAFIHFCYWVVFHSMNRPPFVYLVFFWAFIIFLKTVMNTLVQFFFLWLCIFILLRKMHRNGISKSSDKDRFNIITSCWKACHREGCKPRWILSIIWWEFFARSGCQVWSNICITKNILQPVALLFIFLVFFDE